MSQDLRPLADPGSENFHVELYPFYLLNRAVSRYNVQIEAVLRPIGVDIPSWRVLMILAQKEPQAITQVGRSAVINLSTMMRIVERMQKNDLIVARTSPEDGRVTELLLTETGREKVALSRKATAPTYRRLIEGFSAEDFSRLLDLLNRLYDNLD